jgi:hypothetical protein
MPRCPPKHVFHRPAAGPADAIQDYRTLAELANPLFCLSGGDIYRRRMMLRIKFPFFPDINNQRAPGDERLQRNVSDIIGLYRRAHVCHLIICY